MATSQATSNDVVSRSLRPLTTDEVAWATVRLRDVFDQILVRVPSAATRLDAGTITDPFNRLVIQIQCSAVLRVLSNPSGILEETIDDYTRRLDAAVSAGQLYVTDAEYALLTAWDGANDGAWTIRAKPVATVSSYDPWQGGFPTLTTDTW